MNLTYLFLCFSKNKFTPFYGMITIGIYQDFIIQFIYNISLQLIFNRSIIKSLSVLKFSYMYLNFLQGIDPSALLQTHIQGVINHGKGDTSFFIDINEYAHVANLVMNILLKSIYSTRNRVSYWEKSTVIRK